MKPVHVRAIVAGVILSCVLLGCSQQPESLKKDIIPTERRVESAQPGFGFEAGAIIYRGATVDVEAAGDWAYVASEINGIARVVRRHSNDRMLVNFWRNFMSATGVELVDLAASTAGYAVLLKSTSAIDIDGLSYSGDGVLAVFSPANQLLFARSYTGYIPSASYEPLGVAMGNDGRVAMVGGTVGPVAVDTGVIVVGNSSGSYSPRPILAVYDANGSVTFAHGSSASDRSGSLTFAGVEFDSSGRLVIAGAHRTGTSFGPCSLGGIEYSKPHVVVFNTDGSCAFSYEPVASLLLSQRHSFTRELAVAANSVVIRGWLPHPPEYLDFGAGPLYGHGRFLARFDGNMNLIYAKKVSQDMEFMAARDDGHVLIASSFSGTIDLGTGPITSPGMSTSIVLSELDSAGAIIDAEAILPNATPQHPTALAVFPAGSAVSGRALLTGQYFTWGPTALAAVLNDPLLNGMFLLKSNKLSAPTYDFLVSYSSD